MMQKIATGLLLLTLALSINARTGVVRLIRADHSAQENNGSSTLWNITPPAPKIAEADRLAELAARRAEVMKRVGQRGLLILFSGVPHPYTLDVDYPFRQENNFYYLTGIKQAGATLILIPGAKTTREILFMPHRNPAAETWTGHMLSVEESRAQSGVQEVWDDAWLNGFLAVLDPRAGGILSQRGEITKFESPRLESWREEFRTLRDAIRNSEGELYLLLPLPFPNERESREFRSEQTLAAQMASTAVGLTVKNAWPIFSELRLRKSPWELRLLQHAVDITAEAFSRAYALAAPGVFEYELQAEFEYTYRRHNADWGYPCIVGGGANATTLHYETNQEALPANGLLLMDCSAEYDHYTGDVTRTIPISGKFTKEQAEIYRLVYAAQMEAIKHIRPGVRLATSGQGLNSNPIYTASADVIKEGLLRLGLITSKDNDEYRIWFMHGSTHWIGMNVHDVGDYTTPLAPGMVFTVEPGIYIRPDALDMLPKTPENEKFIAAVRPAFEKYKGIGVRIEDDVLVTEGGAKVMSAAVPSKLEEVEAVMARLKQETTPGRLRSLR
ncbi:MAG TPA: aminopeptidase P family protein [Blastocatellia bacterium]|nr:aminopeptidase P family protein [Blastocatellia bacterium]